MTLRRQLRGVFVCAPEDYRIRSGRRRPGGLVQGSWGQPHRYPRVRRSGL